MPAQKRFKTKYPGVFYIKGTAVGSGKPERIYYIDYRKDGKRIQERAGRQYQDDMTPARAAQQRTLKIQGKALSNRERRESEKAAKEAEENKWTLDRLFEVYMGSRPDNKGKTVDTGRYKKHIGPVFGTKEPVDIAALDVDRLRVKLLKKKSAQTTKHVLNLLTWVINYGMKNNLCQGIPFHIKKPRVNNRITEDLTAEQLKDLLNAIDADTNTQVANLMRLALHTGMRRGELFKLQWTDIDFQRGFISLRDPKGGPDQRIPINEPARQILLNHPKTGSEYVFPGRGGKQRQTAQAAVNRIKERAGLPKNFRPLHGLRHAYASMLASSGEVDMYQLQRLLTHKDSRMTMRYAHLRDEAMKRAADVAGKIISEAAEDNELDTKKVVNFDDRKK